MEVNTGGNNDYSHHLLNTIPNHPTLHPRIGLDGAGEKENDMNTVHQQINQIIKKITGCETEEITEDAHFEDDLGCDSLDGIDILMRTEYQFNISLPDEALERVKTVRDYYTLVESYL